MTTIKVVLSLLSILGAVNISTATRELTEDERFRLVSEVNKLRGEQGASDMLSVCWADSPFEDVYTQADNCSNTIGDVNGVFMSKISAPGTDIVADSIAAIKAILTAQTPPLNTCAYYSSCGAAKIFVTSIVYQMFCVKTECEGTPSLFCGLRAIEMMPDAAYIPGAPCANCLLVPNTCYENTCASDECLAKLTTTTTTTTTTTAIPTAEDTVDSPTKDEAAMNMSTQQSESSPKDCDYFGKMRGTPTFFMQMFASGSAQLTGTYALGIVISLTIYLIC